MPFKQRAELWKVVDQEAILSYLNDAVQLELIQDMPAATVARAIETVDMLQNLPDEVVEACLQEVDLEHYRRLRQVLFYPENSAGGLMNTDMASLRTEKTDLLTSNLRDLVEQIMSINIEAIAADLSDHDVALLFEQRDLLSASVTLTTITDVIGFGTLLGLATILLKE